ncbi:hypothetical protein OPIT5_16590 [Opitutaceae bacterium TAV5]|nr:hypothetical protein OPIT5_16590 [Opitutaceae bacterium TAV5]
MQVVRITEGNRSASTGFTLVELLVSLGITAALVTGLLTITGHVLGVWNRSSGKLQTGNDARRVLDQLTADLQGAIMRRDGNAWLVATLQRDQGVTGDTGMDAKFKDKWKAGAGGAVKPGAGDGSLDFSDGREPRFGQAGVWLRFFTTPPDNHVAAKSVLKLHDVSAPRAVSWRMIRGEMPGGGCRYLLFRAEVRPCSDTATGRSTFELGYDLLGGVNGSEPGDSAASFGYNKGSGTEADPGNVIRPNANQLIATEVVDFGIRLFGQDNAGARVEVFPCHRDAAGALLAGGSIGAADLPVSHAASTVRNTATAPVTCLTVGDIEYGFPVAAEIFLRILTPQGATMLTAFEEDTGRFPGRGWWDIVEEYSEVFVRWVEILAPAF